MESCSSYRVFSWTLNRLFVRLKDMKHKLIKVFLGVIVMMVVYSQFDWVFVEQYALYPCQLPNIDPFDKSLRGFFYKMPAINCTIIQSPVSFDDSGYLNIDTTLYPLAEHYKQDNASIHCSYAEVLQDGENAIKLSTPSKDLSTKPDSDFVVVKCTNGNETILSDVKYQMKLGRENVDVGYETDDKLSLIIIGLDSVSRLVAENKIPKTLAYFRNKLESYDLTGYTKVGDNTVPNLLAALSGQTVMDALVPTFDFPPLYKKLKSKGYVTCFSEDWIAWRPPFGFYYPDYPHNLRTFFLAGDTYPPFVKDTSGSNKLYNDNKYKRNKRMCFGGSFQHDIIIDYVDKCIRSYDNRLKYSFTWINEIGHEDVNYLEIADDKIKTTLEKLNNDGKLNKSVVILMGDHGPRYGKALENDLLRFTGRLPMLHLVLPKHIKQKYPHIDAHLKTNINRLTTPFDLHEALNDIVDPNYKETCNFKPKEKLPRGISLFREIPRSRSCYEASISEHYCPCYSSTDVSVKDADVQKATDFLVSHIQSRLSKNKHVCSEISLEKVKSAKLQKNHDGAANTRRYVVLFSTRPGNGVYEGTVDVSNTGLKLLGDINRLTAYGNTADCIRDSSLKLYCYCKSETGNSKS